jgi:hypothetical protein
MHLTPRAMLKYGELYLNRGRMHEKQIVSAHWVEESLKARTRSSWSGRDYGFGWWIDNLGGQTIHYAWGHGGQFIFTVPRLRLVVVTTAVPAPDDGRREHQRAIYDLMERHLIPTAEKSCSHLAEPSRVSTELTDRTVLRQTCRSGLIRMACRGRQPDHPFDEHEHSPDWDKVLKTTEMRFRVPLVAKITI